VAHSLRLLHNFPRELGNFLQHRVVLVLAPAS
jgi:hypothetical protein